MAPLAEWPGRRAMTILTATTRRFPPRMTLAMAIMTRKVSVPADIAPENTRHTGRCG